MSRTTSVRFEFILYSGFDVFPALSKLNSHSWPSVFIVLTADAQRSAAAETVSILAMFSRRLTAEFKVFSATDFEFGQFVRRTIVNAVSVVDIMLQQFVCNAFPFYVRVYWVISCTFWTSLLLRFSPSPKFGLRPKISRKVKSFSVWTERSR